MNRHNRLRLTQVAKRKRDVRIDTLRCKMPELDKLFEELRQGTAPNFLLVMAGISELTAFQTDHVQAKPVCKDKSCLFC